MILLLLGSNLFQLIYVCRLSLHQALISSLVSILTPSIFPERKPLSFDLVAKYQIVNSLVVTGIQWPNIRQSTHWQFQVYSGQISDSQLIGSYRYIVVKYQTVNSLVVTCICGQRPDSQLIGSYRFIVVKYQIVNSLVVTGLQWSNTRQSIHWQLQVYSGQIPDSQLIGSYRYIVAKYQIVNSLVVTGLQWSNIRQLIRILSYLIKS